MMPLSINDCSSSLMKGLAHGIPALRQRSGSPCDRWERACDRIVAPESASTSRRTAQCVRRRVQAAHRLRHSSKPKCKGGGSRSLRAKLLASVEQIEESAAPGSSVKPR